MSKAMQDVDMYKRSVVEGLLKQCTEPQQNLFKRMYGDVATMDSSNIDIAIRQCERTIEKNKSDGKV